MIDNLINKTIGWRKQDLIENSYYNYLNKMECLRHLDYSYHAKYNELLFLDWDMYGKYISCQGYFSELKEHGESENCSKERAVSVLTTFLSNQDLSDTRSEFYKTYRYEIYREIVDIVLNEKYDMLWDINYEKLKANKEEIISALIDFRDVINSIFKKHLKLRRNISQVIITSILLGTFNCFPA